MVPEDAPVIEQKADDDSPAALFGHEEEPAPKPEPEPEPTPEPEPEPEPKLEPEPELKPEDQPIDIDGEKMTIAEYRKRKQDADTWRNQLTHFQKLAEERKEILDRIVPLKAAGDPRQSPPPPEPKQATLEDWKKEMDRNVEGMVAAGMVEKDSVELAPDLARGFAALYQEAVQLRQFRAEVEKTYAERVAPLVESMEQGRAQSHRNSVIQALHAKIDEVSALGEYYAPLAQPATRNTFITYLSEKVNPEISRLQADGAVEFLAQQYVAMTRDPLLKTVQELARQRVAPQKGRNVQGEGAPGAAAPKKVPPKNKDIVDLFRGE